MRPLWINNDYGNRNGVVSGVAWVVDVNGNALTVNCKNNFLISISFYAVSI